MSSTGKNTLTRHYAPWLWLLTGLFCLRVIAQPVTLFVDIPYVPPFEQWHSATLPYGVLLAGQLVIIAVLIRTALAFSSGRVAPARRLGVALLSLGTAYLGVMLSRLLLGLTILGGHRWFTSHVPTLFHIVLATFVLLLGKFHSIRSKECSR